jgi:hypothetical protein
MSSGLHAPAALADLLLPPATGLKLLPFLQSDAANSKLTATYGAASMLASPEGTAVELTHEGRLVFADLATNTTLWSPELAAAPRPGGPHQLELTASGELRLTSAGLVTWRSGTRGRARGPFRLTARGQDLALRDLATNRTIWLAPVQCGSFRGIEVPASGQCGGAAPHEDSLIRATVHAADAPYGGACCPTGFKCSRQSSQLWRCEPSGALDSCTAGVRVLAPLSPCGGLNLCGQDAACSSRCCREGSFCRRSNAFTWSCTEIASFAGGLV